MAFKKLNKIYYHLLTYTSKNSLDMDKNHNIAEVIKKADLFDLIQLSLRTSQVDPHTTIENYLL
jgi:hypothetical protein